MSPRPNRPTLIANPSTRQPAGTWFVLAFLAMTITLALVLVAVTPAGWQNPRTEFSGTSGPAFSPTMAAPSPGTPTGDRTSGPTPTCCPDVYVRMTPVPSPQATRTPANTPEPCDGTAGLCWHPAVVPTRVPTVVPTPQPVATYPACSDVSQDWAGWCWVSAPEPATETPDLVSVTDTILAPLDFALMVLEASGLVVEVVCVPSGDSFNDPGTVYASDPGPGARIARGSVVILSVEPPCLTPTPATVEPVGVPTNAIPPTLSPG